MASAAVKLEKIVIDVQDCVTDLKSEFQDTKIPIDDDCTILHRFCAKLEYALQFGQKNKANILGSKKDYWDYIRRALASDNARGIHDGVKFVKCLPELKTSLGKGRAFIRFCLVHQCLADTLQHCLINEKITSTWYDLNSILRKQDQWSALVTSLYELSEVQFDLSPRGHDLDVSWPTFARKIFGGQYSWRPPSRSISVSSLSSLASQVDSVSSHADSKSAEEHEQMEQEIVEQSEVDAKLDELLQDDVHNIDEGGKESQMDAIAAELEQAKVENVKLKEKLSHLTSSFEKKEADWTNQINAAEKIIKEQETNISVLKAENSKYNESVFQQKVDQLESEKLQLKEHLQQLETELNGLRTSEAECNDTIELLRSEVTNLRSTNGDLKSALERLHETNEQQAAENVMICQRLGELSSQLEASKLSLQDLHKEKCTLQSKLEASENQNKDYANTISAMKKECSNLKQQVDHLENENRQLQWQTLEREKESISIHKEVLYLKSHLQNAASSLCIKEGEADQAKANINELKQCLSHILQDNTQGQNNVMEKLTEIEKFILKLGDDVKDLTTNVLCDVNSSIAKLVSRQVSSSDSNQNSSMNDIPSQSSLQLIESLFQKQETVINNLLEKIEGFLKGSYHFNAHMNVLQKLLNVEVSDDLTTPVETLESQFMTLEDVQAFKFDTKQQIRGSSGVVNTVGRILNKLCELLKKNIRLQLELDMSHRLSSYLVHYIQEHRKQISEATIDVAATENIVALLHKEHTKLKTAEAILKYELQQKRKLLTSLREQLSSSRKQWCKVQKIHTRALTEWKDLRTEFSLRNKQASEESGFVDDRSKDTDSDIPDEELGSSPDGPTLNDAIIVSHDGNASEIESPPEDTDSELVTEEPEGAAAAAAPAEPTRNRLDILEEQCRLLYVSLLRSSQRSAFLEQRLQALLSSDEETLVDFVMPSTSGENDQDNTDPIGEDPASIDPSEPSSPEGDDNVWEDDVLPSQQECSTVNPNDHNIQDVYGSETPSEDSCTQSMQDDVADENKELICLCGSESDVGELRKKALDKLVAKLKDERAIHESEMATMKEEMERLQVANSQLQERLKFAEKEKEFIANRESEFRKRVDFIFKKERGSFDARVSELIDSKSALETKVHHMEEELNNQAQLVTVLESSLQEARDELSKTKSDTTNEILNLKLQHNAETLKYEQSLKHYIEQEDKIANLKEQIQDQSNVVISLESTLAEIKETRAEEKERHWHELEELKVTLSTRDEECSILNDELKKALKEVDDERKKLELMKTEHEKKQIQFKDYISELESKLTQVQADNVELKNNLVKLLKDKDILWKKTVQLGQSSSLIKTDKWMDDKDVTNCLDCKAPFSLMLRRHHCRICGGIFCRSCSSNWITFNTSRRPARACNACYEKHLQTDPVVAGADGDGNNNVPDEADDVLGMLFTSNSVDSCFLDNDTSSIASFYNSDFNTSSFGGGPGIVYTPEVSNVTALGSDLMDYALSDPLSMESEPSISSDVIKDQFDFYIITDEEISRSLSACSPYSSFTGEINGQIDGVQMIFARTVDDIEEGGTAGVSGEIWVNAGQQIGVPVIIEEISLKLIWEFTSEPKSTSFSLIFKEMSSLEDLASSIQVLLGSTRVRSHEYTIHGHLIAKKPGMYILIFDNHHSKFMAKKISYNLKVQRNTSERPTLSEE